MSSPSRLAPDARSATAVAAAGTAWLRDRLGAPPHEARVLHAGPDAVYLEDGDHCIGVLSAAAVAVPCGLRTTLPSLGEVGRGSAALVGDGRVVLGRLEVALRSVVDASVPRVDRLPDVPPRLVAHVRDAMPLSALAALAAADPSAVPALLGRGEGLTPLGDDVLAGWIAGRQATGSRSDAVAAEVRRLAPGRTTLLSATLLDCALRGDVLPPVRAWLGSGEGLDAVLAVGGTSGAGLALGLSLAKAPA